MTTTSEKLTRIHKQCAGMIKADTLSNLEEIEGLCNNEGIKLSTFLQYIDRVIEEEYTQECLDLNFHSSSAKNK